MYRVSPVDLDVKRERRAAISLTIGNSKASVDVLIRGSFAGFFRPMRDDDFVNDPGMRVDCYREGHSPLCIHKYWPSASDVSLGTVGSLNLAVNYVAFPPIPEDLGAFVRHIKKPLLTVEENEDVATKHCEEIA